MRKSQETKSKRTQENERIAHVNAAYEKKKNHIHKQIQNCLPTCSIEVGYVYDDNVTFKVSSQSEVFAYPQLKALSVLFGTENITISDLYITEGCDTCGHGSEEGFHINIRDYNIKKG